MKNFLLSILIFSAILTACTHSKSPTEVPVAVNLNEIGGKAGELTGKLITIEGMVAHVCRESGKRLFLGEQSFKILATNKLPTFKIEWEGSDIIATGYLKEDRIDEAYLTEWEKELEEGAQVRMKEETHTYEAESKGLDELASNTQLDQIKRYREQIAESGKGYVSLYSLLAERIVEKK
jgi:hypothetical protein